MPGGALSQRTYGNAVHGLLAQVGQRSDWDHIQPRLGSSFGMDPEQRDEVVKAVEDVLFHAEWKRFFEAPVDHRFAERPLRLSSGEVGRPDRVVKLEDGWHVLDYKTGTPDKKHHLQVKSYMDAIAEMEPGKKVFGWLLYTRDLVLVPVD